MNVPLAALLPACRAEHATRIPAENTAEPRRRTKAFVSDGEVDQTIALLGGDEREAVRALLYALDNITSRSQPPERSSSPELSVAATGSARAAR